MSNPAKNIDTNTDLNASRNPLVRNFFYSFPEGKSKWRIQNDVVMGGSSIVNSKMTADNHAHFRSCFIRKMMAVLFDSPDTEKNPYEIAKKSVSFVLTLKGDGKDYNFRVRTQRKYQFTVLLSH
jgi:hypothetical protein